MIARVIHYHVTRHPVIKAHLKIELFGLITISNVKLLQFNDNNINVTFPYKILEDKKIHYVTINDPIIHQAIIKDIIGFFMDGPGPRILKPIQSGSQPEPPPDPHRSLRDINLSLKETTKNPDIDRNPGTKNVSPKFPTTYEMAASNQEGL